MKEIWKDIKGYKDFYQVSSLGRFKRLPRTDTKNTVSQKILKLTLDKKGNLIRIAFRGKDCKFKQFVAKTVVAETFIKNPHHLKRVIHIDENIFNITSSNLKWSGSNDHLGSVIQYDLEGNKVQDFESIAIAARSVKGFSATTISNIERVCISNALSKNKTTEYSAIGYVWRFKNPNIKEIKKINIHVTRYLKKNLKFGKRGSEGLKVIQFSNKNKKIRTFKSIKEASKETGVAISSISRVCRRSRKYAGGFIWKYVE